MSWKKTGTLDDFPSLVIFLLEHLNTRTYRGPYEPSEVWGRGPQHPLSIFCGSRATLPFPQGCLTGDPAALTVKAPTVIGELVHFNIMKTRAMRKKKHMCAWSRFLFFGHGFSKCCTDHLPVFEQKAKVVVPLL